LIRFLIGAVITLHALVHFWFIALAMKLFPFEPQMGWTTKSWLFTNLLGDDLTRKLAALLLFIVMLVMATGGVAFIFGAGWSRPILIGAAVASIAVIVLFWDGSFDLIVSKGLIAVLLDLGVIAAAAWLP
jgi:hypothetical protein